MRRAYEQEISNIIGQNIRLFRMKAGLSQIKLSYMLGVTFQQVQKYEKGETRIYASTLYNVATHLKTPVADFFKDLPKQETLPSRVGLEKMFNDIAGLSTKQRQTVALVIKLLKDAETRS